MNKKKILIVTEYFYPEEFKINELAIEWQKKGFNVEVLTKQPSYPKGEIYNGYDNKLYTIQNYKNIKIHRVKTITGYKNNLIKKILNYLTFMILGSIISIKISKKFDNIFGFSAGALTGMIPTIIPKVLYKKKVTLWIQDIWPDSVYAFGFKKRKILVWVLNKLVSFVYNNTDNFAISGEGFKNKIKPYLKENKTISYLPNWTDELKETNTKFHFSSDKKLHFTFAGNIGHMQNLNNVIKAFEDLPIKYLKKAQLNIIGDGSFLNTLKKLSREKQYKHTIFWGKFPREKMNVIFNGSDFLIVSLINKPIFSLTVPSKVQTYIATKKPILAFINGDTKQLIEENNLGFHSEPDNIENIQKSFIKAMNITDTERKSIEEQAAFLTKTRFNKSKITNKLLTLLTQA